MTGKQTSSIGSFFRILLSNIIVLFFIAACIYQGIYKFNNMSETAQRTITRFAINGDWIDIILYFCLAVLLIILIVYFDKVRLQKRHRDRRIMKLEKTIDELKNKYENPPKKEKTVNVENLPNVENLSKFAENQPNEKNITEDK